ncbi:MAG: UDP-glucose 4-epimerase [Thermoprotei archaeon]|nr:MAG: UDP-glucose 4-epimerase [Thermoprotei archaeon]
MKKLLVTGGAGFIGSHLVERLLIDGFEVTCLDNLSAGNIDNLKNALKNKFFHFIKGDIRNRIDIQNVLDDYDTIFHFAANPEVRLGDPEIHFSSNILGTFNILESMRKSDVKRIVFASSSTVYGDASVLPTPENYSPLQPISVYGASKLACEALISSYCHVYGFNGICLRYANIIGPRLRHGVIYDFIMKLKKNPRRLEILGDGTQRKSYLYISDAINATTFIWNRCRKGYYVYNVGNKDSITVMDIARIVVELMNLRNVEFYTTGGVDGGRGWKGDVKYMLLSIEKLESIGWRPKYNSMESVKMTAKALIEELGV